MGGSDPSIEQNDALNLPSFTPAYTLFLLTTFRRFMGWEDASLVDIEDLHSVACRLSDRLEKPSASRVLTAVRKHRLPADSIALVFAAIAFGAVATNRLDHGKSYFSISTETLKHFVGQPTMDLCLALFLQHVFAIRTGTSNYAQGIIAQVIQVGHELGLHRGDHGIRGLQLYLLIYMADQ